MKEKYLKPDAHYLELEIEETIMDSIIIPSWEVGEDDEEGI